jgi:shikimate kinase
MGEHLEPNLVLIGYRATGKTSVGRELAARLKRPFVDLDEVLVREAGCSIAELVAQRGWGDFRRREKELVRRFAKAAGQVLATGGGVVLDPENVETLRDNGIIIWLEADPSSIRTRLGLDATTQAFRPSLTGADVGTEVARVLAEREPLYRNAAHIIIDTTNLSATEVSDRIMAALKEMGSKSSELGPLDHESSHAK